MPPGCIGSAMGGPVRPRLSDQWHRGGRLRAVSGDALQASRCWRRRHPLRCLPGGCVKKETAVSQVLVGQPDNERKAEFERVMSYVADRASDLRKLRRCLCLS